MKAYTPQDFVCLLKNELSGPCSFCNKHEFESWANVKKDALDALSDLGELANSDAYIQAHGYTEHHPAGTNYWSKDAPVALAYYPYHESKIKECPHCHAIFLHYIEYAGHAPQKRLRLIQKELISLEGLE